MCALRLQCYGMRELSSAERGGVTPSAGEAFKQRLHRRSQLRDLTLLLAPHHKKSNSLFGDNHNTRGDWCVWVTRRAEELRCDAPVDALSVRGKSRNYARAGIGYFYRAVTHELQGKVAELCVKSSFCRFPRTRG